MRIISNKKIIIIIFIILVGIYCFWGYTIPKGQIKNDIEQWLSIPYPLEKNIFEYEDNYHIKRVAFYTGQLKNQKTNSRFLVGYKKNVFLPLYKRISGDMQSEESNKYHEYNYANINTYFYNYQAKASNINGDLSVTETLVFDKLWNNLLLISGIFVMRIVFRKISNNS